MERLQLFIKDLSSEWGEKKPARQAAALAYYGMFSLAPVLFVALTISEFIFKQVDLSSEVFTRIAEMFGPEAASFVESLVAGVASPENGITSQYTSPLISLISIGVLLYAASGLFYHLQYSLDAIWDVSWQVEGSILYVIQSRLIAFLLVIALGLFLVFLEMVTVAVSVLRSFFQLGDLYPFIDTIILLGIEALVLILIYRFLPRARVSWRDVALAAVLTAILINIGRWGVGLYLSLSNVSSAFQAAGSLAVILVAIYYGAQIFLFGAVFSRVYAHHFGSRKGVPLRGGDGGTEFNPADSVTQ
jgi:membrane protein